MLMSNIHARQQHSSKCNAKYSNGMHIQAVIQTRIQDNSTECRTRKMANVELREIASAKTVDGTITSDYGDLLKESIFNVIISKA